MNILNQSDLSNRPVIKYIIIAVIAANAVILALLLFGPGRLSPAASPRGTEEDLVSAGSTVETAEDSNSRQEEDNDSREEDDDRHGGRDDADADDSEDSSKADTGETAEEAEDESGPVLELVDDHVTLKVGDYFNFYEYIKTMKDIDGSDLSRYIHLKGEVNTYTPGDYTITYQITSPINGKTASEDLRVTVEY
jgi:hypothetical protein